jgi:hypothetical protein
LSLEVRRLVGDDWPVLRDLRLAALLDAPTAFGSTHAREAAFGEADWRRRIGGAAVFLGRHGGVPAGLSGGYVDGDGEAHLVMMWVRAPARGSGPHAALTTRRAALDAQRSSASRQGGAPTIGPGAQGDTAGYWRGTAHTAYHPRITRR